MNKDNNKKPPKNITIKENKNTLNNIAPNKAKGFTFFILLASLFSNAVFTTNSSKEIS